jgi:hypothetical protein
MGKMDVFGKFLQAACPKNNFLNVWKNNTGDKSFPNQMFFYTIGKFSKCHIKNDLAFSIWDYELKVIMKRNQELNFQLFFSLLKLPKERNNFKD